MPTNIRIQEHRELYLTYLLRQHELTAELKKKEEQFTDWYTCLQMSRQETLESFQSQIRYLEQTPPAQNAAQDPLRWGTRKIRPLTVYEEMVRKKRRFWRRVFIRLLSFIAPLVLLREIESIRQLRSTIQEQYNRQLRTLTQNSAHVERELDERRLPSTEQRLQATIMTLRRDIQLLEYKIEEAEAVFRAHGVTPPHLPTSIP